MQLHTIKCAFCQGTGNHPHLKRACPVCNSTGHNQITGPYATCADCHGTGQKGGTTLTCYTCAGLGVLPDTHEQMQAARKAIQRGREELAKEKAQFTE